MYVLREYGLRRMRTSTIIVHQIGLLQFKLDFYRSDHCQAKAIILSP